MPNVIPHLLFVCGRNQWRSPTAERLYRADPRVEVRSAGVSPKSRHQISRADIEWADLILVMEASYSAHIRERFCQLALPPMKSLDIPDEYEFMDDELIVSIKSGVEHYIDRLAETVTPETGDE
jgi:predicted protein tyrosine phosphatase